MATITPVAQVLLQQLAHQSTADRACSVLVAMTGCYIIHDDEAVTLHFKRQTGAQKITHLKVTYNAGADLYDLQGFRFNRKTFQCPEVWSLGSVYAEDLKRICEELTGLYFTL